jgi:15-cis-phytoene synthase
VSKAFAPVHVVPVLDAHEDIDIPAVSESYAACREVAQHRAGNFFHGMRLMARDKRPAMYAVYAWMRLADDLADDVADAHGHDTRKRQRLEVFRQQTRLALNSDGLVAPALAEHAPFWPAICDTLQRHQVNTADLDAMIDGQLQDQTKRRYNSFHELYDYCYKVASTVGLVCLSVWGYSGGADTRKLAEQRGIALQLTNILRDVVEDAQRDRLYLPAQDLARFDLDADTLLAMLRGRRDDPRVSRLIAYECQRAAGYYAVSAPLESRITPDARATCWAMMRIYRGLLTKIERDPAAVLRGRVSLGKPTKLAIALRALWRFRGGRSPAIAQAPSAGDVHA